MAELSERHPFLAPPKTEFIFSSIYDIKAWGVGEDGQGSSGLGSSAEATREYRLALETFLKTHDVKSVVDLGCGDWQFSKLIDWTGIEYVGVDVVKKLTDANTEKYGRPNITFLHLDAITEDLPAADLLVCKCVLQHLSNDDVLRIARHFPKYKYCLITNDVCPSSGTSDNADGPRGGYRWVDLTQPPFSISGVKYLTYSAPYVTKQTLLITRGS